MKRNNEELGDLNNIDRVAYAVETHLRTIDPQSMIDLAQSNGPAAVRLAREMQVELIIAIQECVMLQNRVTTIADLVTSLQERYQLLMDYPYSTITDVVEEDC